MTTGKPSWIRFASTCLLLAALPSAVLPAAELPAPMLVADRSPGLAANEFLPRQLAEIGGLLYFSGYDDQHGEEPWVSDGTAAGTHLIADLCPGDCGSEIGPFEAIGERIVVFSSANLVLYAIDGGQVVELHHGFSSARGFVRLGSLLYFEAAINNGLPRMWRTDGTAAGTRVSPDFCTETSCDSLPFAYGAANGAIYFARDGQLFALVAEGERRALAALEHAIDPTPLDATRVIFAGCSSLACSLWVSDGTAAGTFDLQPDSGVLGAALEPFVGWRGRIYFANRAGQMASTDGTVAGTHLEPSFGGQRPRPFAANSDYLLYTVESSGNTVLRARHSGGGDSELGATSLHFVRHRAGRLGEKIFFFSSSELLATDGTSAGTVSLGDYSSPSNGVVFGGRYHFGGDSEGGAAPGLFSSDGTVAGTTRVDLGVSQALGSRVVPYRLGSLLLADYDRVLERVDPETFAANTVFGDQRTTTVAAGRDVFYTSLWVGPERTLHSVGETTETALPAGLVTAGAVAEDDHLFFTDATPGQELIESDGTAAGTRELFELGPVACPGQPCPPELPEHITPSGDRVFFLGPNTSSGQGTSIWSWRRGDAAPTEVLQRAQIFFGGFFPISGGRVLFSSFTAEPQPKYRLWISDGTVAGTRMLPNLPDSPDHLVAVGNRVFFTFASGLSATDFATTYSLGAEGVSELEVAGDRVFFAGRKSGEGSELGFSDGTPDGTRWLDLRPGPAGSYPRDLFALGDGRVVFGASADGAGYELWISDGTAEGTWRLTDLAPGIAASSPHNFALVGRRLFFRASDGVAGQELWALDLPPAAAPLPPCPADRLCLRGDRFEVRVKAHAPDGDFAGKRTLANAESGVFTFFSPDNWEMTVKVLDGCHLNDTFWVLAAAASDLDYTLTVKDRASGLEKTYSGAAQAGRPILDTAALAGCGSAAPAPRYSAMQPPAALSQRCADDLSTYCFGPDGRYRVRLDWQAAGQSAQARTVPDGSPGSGLFTFFSPSNWEFMVKLLDGCAINGKRWVFAAGTTDVGWTLTVTDRQTGAAKVYRNPAGQPSKTVADGAAFDCR